MTPLDRYLKGLIVLVWGAAIAVRTVDLREVLAESKSINLASPVNFAVSPVQADILAILMSLIIIAGAFAFIGRVRKSWLLICVMIAVSKIVMIAADARVGDLPIRDLTLTSLVTFILPAGIMLLLVQSRHFLEKESTSSV